MLIYGIDPGLSGAIAVLANGELMDVQDLPVVAVSGGTVKRALDPAALAALLRGWRAQIGVDAEHAAIEFVAARPGQGVAGVFSLGHTAGAIAGVVATLGIPSQLVTPMKWKRALGVSSDKTDARAAASRLFPSHAGRWARVRDDGRAEAALIAFWAWSAAWAWRNWQ